MESPLGMQADKKTQMGPRLPCFSSHWASWELRGQRQPPVPLLYPFRGPPPKGQGPHFLEQPHIHLDKARQAGEGNLTCEVLFGDTTPSIARDFVSLLFSCPLVCQRILSEIARKIHSTT